MSYSEHTLPGSPPAYLPSNPPAPPPKPATSSTPSGGPPPLPPPPHVGAQNGPSELDAGQTSSTPRILPQQSMPAIEGNWLPRILQDKSTQDLQSVLSSPDLQTALISHAGSTHPAIASSESSLAPLIQANLEMSNATLELDARLRGLRQRTQSRLLALRALEQQHRTKISETEGALRDFSPRALYQRLSASVQEQEQLVRTMEESWLDEDGTASERETAEFVRRVKEAKKVAFLRHERRNRWDEARVGGWR